LKRKQPGDPVTLHGRYEAHVVRPEACHAVSFDQPLPKPAQLLPVRKQRETPLEEA
jgi:hypothetical protein